VLLEQQQEEHNNYYYVINYARRFSIERNSYGNVAGWVSVTLPYCIKTAKPIRKLFRPSESSIILVFWDPCADTKFHGEPLHRGR